MSVNLKVIRILQMSKLFTHLSLVNYSKIRLYFEILYKLYVNLNIIGVRFISSNILIHFTKILLFKKVYYEFFVPFEHTLKYFLRSCKGQVCLYRPISLKILVHGQVRCKYFEPTSSVSSCI